MAFKLNLHRRAKHYDPDDPDNFKSGSALVGGSNVIPWMFGGMFVVTTVIGLFFAQGSPLIRGLVAHVTESTTAQPALPKTQSN